jgi:putative endonuclease
MPYYVYIIESELDGSYYKGFTEDPESRLSRHNNGETVSTRNKRPWRLIFLQKYEQKSEALKREKTLKTWNRSKLQELILSGKNELLK